MAGLPSAGRYGYAVTADGGAMRVLARFAWPRTPIVALRRHGSVLFPPASADGVEALLRLGDLSPEVSRVLAVP